MAKNIYDGDPRLFLDQDGAYLDFVDGQPIMDAGLENTAIIPLFTRRLSRDNKKPWVGNIVFDDANVHLGSDFLDGFEKPITFGRLEDDKKRAKKALQFFIDSGLAKDVNVEVTNPSTYRIDVRIQILPPDIDLAFVKNGANWIIQGGSPAGGGGIPPVPPIQEDFGFGTYNFSDEEFGEGP